jgi:hypothetical protein
MFPAASTFRRNSGSKGNGGKPFSQSVCSHSSLLLAHCGWSRTGRVTLEIPRTRSAKFRLLRCGRANVESCSLCSALAATPELGKVSPEPFRNQFDLNTPTGRAMTKNYRRRESRNLKPGFRTLAFSTKSTTSADTSSDKSLIPLYRLQWTASRASAVADHQNAGYSQHVSAARAIRKV